MFGINTAADAQKYLEELQAKQVAPADLYSHAIKVAEADGYAVLMQAIEDHEERAASKGKPRQVIAFSCMAKIAKMLARGADDTYSGRGNDERRAHFDGVREAAEVLIWRFTEEFQSTLEA